MSKSQAQHPSPDPSRRLPNYLRTYRKKSGLSQAELAFLLGCQDGAKVSRYERKVREPTLRTLMALEIVFDSPLRDLFAGVYDEVREQMLRQARALVEQLKLGGPGCLNDVSQSENARKIELLKKLTGEQANEN